MWALLAGSVLILCGLFAVQHIFTYDDDDISDFFDGHDVPFRIQYVDQPSGPVRTVFAGRGHRDTLIVFVHGAPGSWDAFKEYMVDTSLLVRSDMVSYDRPGYGLSYHGKAVPSLQEQASALKAVMDSYDYEHYILVGHSYGGPIITQYAINHPHSPVTLVMIAPAIAPDAEKEWWFAPFGYWKSTRWMLPSSFRVSGIEKQYHVQELYAMTSPPPSIVHPSILVHSLDDLLAPAAGNINFTWDLIPPGKLTSYVFTDKGHLILWTDQKTILSIIKTCFHN